MRQSRIVHSRFIEITTWRAGGETWSEIDKRLFPSDLKTDSDTLRILYSRELERRQSPKRLSMITWLHENYETVNDHLERGYEWDSLLVLLNPTFETANQKAALSSVIVEFNAIEQARTRTQPDQNAPAQQLPAPTPTPIALSEPTPVVNSSAPKIPMETKPTPPPHEPQSEPEQGSAADLIRKYGPRKQEKPRRPRYVKPQPHDDPYISGPELLRLYDEAQSQANELYFQMRQATGDEKEELTNRREIIGSQADQLKVDFEHRFSNARATRSKLTVLSTAALACGAYLVVDQESSKSGHTIKLCGYDRPDEIAGMEEIPDPLFIEENLTPEDQAKIAQAYLQDKETFPKYIPGEPTPTRHLAEALVVRGEYLERRGWHEYDKIVKLGGNDLPSPSLTGTIYLHPLGHYVELSPPLTGSEPTKPQGTAYLPPEIEKRGYWL